MGEIKSSKGFTASKSETDATATASATQASAYKSGVSLALSSGGKVGPDSSDKLPQDLLVSGSDDLLGLDSGLDFMGSSGSSNTHPFAVRNPGDFV